MVSVKLPKMSKVEIDQLLNTQFLCRIVFRGKYSPYIAPFQYVLLDGVLYFHFTDYGKKITLLKEGDPVCVEVERYTSDLSDYCFVVLIGSLHIVTDVEEKDKAIQKMVEDAKVRRLSRNFLPTHGFPKESDWSLLNKEKGLIIVKLVDVTESIGLKSP